MTFYTLINYSRTLLIILGAFLRVAFRHKLKQSLVGVPRKMVLLKFANIKKVSDTDGNKNIQKLLRIRLLYFLFTITRKVVFKDFAHFLETANLRNISLLVRTISITCTIPCKKLFVRNLIFIDVVLGKNLEENSCSESF